MQSDKLLYEYDDICIINLNYILDEAGYFTAIQAHEYDIEYNYANKDIKSLFFHNTINILCDALISMKKYNIRLVYYSSSYESECEDETKNKLDRFITKKISNLLPFQVIEESLEFLSFCNDVRDGEHIINHYISLHLEYDRSRYSMQKLKQFLKRYRLKYLDDFYFTQLNTKLNIIT